MAAYYAPQCIAIDDKKITFMGWVGWIGGGGWGSRWLGAGLKLKLKLLGNMIT